MHNINELPAWERFWHWQYCLMILREQINFWMEKMVQLEMRVAQIEEFRKIAFFHHLILGKV